MLPELTGAAITALEQEGYLGYVQKGDSQVEPRPMPWTGQLGKC